MLVLGKCSVSLYLLSIVRIMTEKVFVIGLLDLAVAQDFVTPVNSEGLGDLFNRSIKNE